MKMKLIPDGIEIILPPRNQVSPIRIFVALFVVMWMVVGGSGVVETIDAFFKGDSGATGTFVVNLLWIVAGVIILGALLLHNCLVISHGQIIRRQTTVFGITLGRIIYPISRIKNIRLISEENTLKGDLIVDYERQTMTLWRGIRVLEGEMLAKQLSDIISFHCYSVKQIIFGVFQSIDDQLYTSLQNPDVSDLTFPFVHLQQILIHSGTYDMHQVERFFTYVINHMDRTYLRNEVEVHIYGELQQLHPNIRNNFMNLCKGVLVHQENESIVPISA